MAISNLTINLINLSTESFPRVGYRLKPATHNTKRGTRNFFLYALLYTALALQVHAQNGPTGFPELVMTNLPGAPKLAKPLLIEGNKPVIAQGYGLAAPAFRDWDGDGLKDLLLGEFSSGKEFSRHFGNFIRVFLNTGSEINPEFKGQFTYAFPPSGHSDGTPYSIDQYCCMGFTPQFVDLNADGREDMITGNYFGEVIWFKGSDKGFLEGENLAQEGDTVLRNDKLWYEQVRWSYSSASFGDFTGDGLPDLITGGRSLQISKNIGTAAAPAFAKRVLLLDTDGSPLKVYEYTPEELKEKQKQEAQSTYVIGGVSRITNPVWVAGDYALSPYVVDWDHDGILDLLVTNSYFHKGLDAVSFFKGTKIKDTYRFQKGVTLFTAKNGTKSFPGSGPRIFITDWNSDGVNDLLIGTSVITVRGEFSSLLSWN